MPSPPGVTSWWRTFAPGTTERLGCGYDAVRAVRPDIIYCSISGFGQTGPYAQRPAYDIIAQGISGFLSMTGHPGGPPTKSGIALNDIAGGVTAVQAILAAYIARLRGEGGQYIDTSLVESGIAWTVWEAAAYFGSGEVAAPAGTRHRRNAPYQAYRTKDGYVTVGGNTQRMWQALCTEVLGRPDWTSRPGVRHRPGPARPRRRTRAGHPVGARHRHDRPLGHCDADRRGTGRAGEHVRPDDR